MGIPDHLTCLLRNLYAGQEATVRTGRGTTDCFQIGKGVCQGCILSPCLCNLYTEFSQFSSVTQLCLTLCDPHGLQHDRPSCPSLTPGVYSNSCPLSRWCHPIISSSVFPFSSCPQSFLASGSFQKSQFFASGGQSIRVSASTSVPLKNIQDWFLLGRTGWISLQSQESSPTPQFKSINSLVLRFLYSPILTTIHDYWENHSFD